MEDLAVNTALNHSGSFGKHFAKLWKKNKNVLHQPQLVSKPTSRLANNICLLQYSLPSTINVRGFTSAQAVLNDKESLFK